MADKIREFLGGRGVYVLILLAVALLLTLTGRFICLIVGLLVLIFYACRPGSALHRATVAKSTVYKRACTVLVAVVTVLVCILPMGEYSLWNGEIPGHRNQYELMAENILEGRLSFDYGDEEELLKLENPYDPDERKESGVKYHWDHAYYDGEYYMYFGVVPVFLVFLPFRILTGASLTTYHATQLFAAAAILGIFALFQLLARRFFKKMSFSVYLALSAAVSVMSVWYSSAEPALYCTAIICAIALQVWSLYFFVKAVWVEQRENRQILFAGIGALLGALVFGCRPPIALANLLVIPMLVVFVRQRKFTAKVFGKLVLAALPYVLVAAGLMAYNYARFDDPFEFGQKYQLTVADQSQYGVSLNAALLVRLFNDLSSSFFGLGRLTEDFPWLRHGGLFINFPILLLTASALKADVRKALRRERFGGVMIWLAMTVLVITVMDILWTPYLLERYHMDVYFLAGIGFFVALGFWQEVCTPKGKKRLSAAVVMLAVITLVCSYLFYMRTVSVYYPDAVEQIGKAFLG